MSLGIPQLEQTVKATIASPESQEIRMKDIIEGIQGEGRLVTREPRTVAPDDMSVYRMKRQAVKFPDGTGFKRTYYGDGIPTIEPYSPLFNRLRIVLNKVIHPLRMGVIQRKTKPHLLVAIKPIVILSTKSSRLLRQEGMNNCKMDPSHTSAAEDRTESAGNEKVSNPG